MEWTKNSYPELLGCPFCGSGNFVFKEDKAFSLRNATKGVLVGSLIAGPFAPLGALAGGILGAKNKRVIYRCLACNETWEDKF